MNNRMAKLVQQDLNRVKVVDASSEEERQAIYQFRYKVHVQELNRKIPGVDHLRKRISDSFDSWGKLVYAELDGRIIGTVRVNVGKTSDFPRELADVFHLDKFQQFEPAAKNLFLGTKLMVDPEYRKTLLPFRLMARGYEIMRENKVQFSFSGCNPYLIPMYEQLGYRTMGTGFQDPGYGLVIPIVLLPEDVEHLAAVRSPFLRMARKMSNSTSSREWFFHNYPRQNFLVNLLTTEQERWEYVAARMGEPLTAIHLLSNLNKEEAGRFLQIATAFGCGQRQQFIRRGDVCNELNILIKGEMDVSEDGRVFRAGPGSIVGAVGLLGQAHHEVDAVTVSECELLAVSRAPFEKLWRLMPSLYGKLNLKTNYKEVSSDEKEYRAVIG